MSSLDAPIGPMAAHRLLARAAYGAKPGEAEAVGRLSLPAWLDAELAAAPRDAPLEAHLGAMTLPVHYRGTVPESAYDARATLETLHAPQTRNWHLGRFGGRMANTERQQPFMELSVATIARKVMARAQLRERMVEFWHDHFSVGVQDPRVSVSIVEHDRRIRALALGRFGDLLEAVATSPAMLIYLSNHASRAGAPNENYGRELLELHTLGAAAYYGSSQNAPRVPGSAAGRPEGFTDGDVWEAARALTGWTIGDGQRLENGRVLPMTGEFVFAPPWHDPYQKRVLGQTLEPFAPAMAHGRAVLDACAANPATARHVVGKLGRFLIGPAVPAACLARGVQAYLRHADAPDQIARVVRALLLGPEVLDPAQGRLRRPLDLVAAVMRGLGQRPWINHPLIVAMENAGQRLFTWPSPEGQPMSAGAYLNSAAMRARWHLLMAVATNQFGSGASTLYPALAGLPVGEVTAMLSHHLLGATETPAARIVASRWALARPDQLPQEREVAEMASFIAVAPAFQST